MDSVVRRVFQVIGILMLSMLLWSIIFGAVGRTFMWGAIEPAMQRHWAEITLNDGRIMSDTLKDVFNSAEEYKLH